VRADFTYDPYQSRLSFIISVRGEAARDIHAVVLQRGNAERQGAVVHRLSGVGVTQTHGVIQLDAADRAELNAGDWSLVAYAARPVGVPAVRIVIRPGG
jgi:hypothetical protein